jgi:hypothetical protein
MLKAADGAVAARSLEEETRPAMAALRPLRAAKKRRRESVAIAHPLTTLGEPKAFASFVTESRRDNCSSARR